MDSIELLKSQSLNIDFDFQNNIGNILIASSLVILTLSEMAINNDDLDYWNIDDRLNKHRTVKDFDAHVQKMLYLLKGVGSLEAVITKSSNNNYHFVEFNDVSRGICIRVLHTFNSKAKYMKKYLDMNNDPNNPKFAYIQYTLDSTKTKVRKIKAVIPSTEGENYRSYNLIRQFEFIKRKLGIIQRKGINQIMRLLKEEISNFALAEVKDP